MNELGLGRFLKSLFFSIFLPPHILWRVAYYFLWSEVEPDLIAQGWVNLQSPGHPVNTHRDTEGTSPCIHPIGLEGREKRLWAQGETLDLWVSDATFTSQGDAP